MTQNLHICSLVGLAAKEFWDYDRLQMKIQAKTMYCVEFTVLNITLSHDVMMPFGKGISR